jgi:2-dehydro-3-deoxygluconokinase
MDRQCASRARMSAHVVCFGELLLRLSSPGAERLLQGPSLDWHAGGSEANVAAQLAQLRVPTRYLTRVPDHAVADAVVAALAVTGVDCDAILRGGTRLGSYFLERGASLRPLRVIYDRAGSAFSELTPGQVEWDRVLAGAHWLHSSGITAGVGIGPTAVLADGIAAARRHGIRTSIDLNWRPAVWGTRDPQSVLPALVQSADLLIGNPAACRAMLGLACDANDHAARATLARTVRDRFDVRQVAITHRVVESASRHRFQALVLDGPTDTVIASPEWTVDVVDRVGGGDAFAGALLAELARNAPLTDAVPFAVAASALKLTVPGDMNRVTRAEIVAAQRAQVTP